MPSDAEMQKPEARPVSGFFVTDATGEIPPYRWALGCSVMARSAR